MSPSSTDDLATVAALANLAQLDPMYGDQYLHRAQLLLANVCTSEQFRALLLDQARLPALTDSMRRAAERDDWTVVHSLAEQGLTLRQRLGGSADLLQLADTVYGPHLFRPDPSMLALAGVVIQSTSALEKKRNEVLHQLTLLATADPENAGLYRSRQRFFQHMQAVTDDDVAPPPEQSDFRERLLAAINAADFSQIQRLTELVPAAQHDAAARLRVVIPEDARFLQLSNHFPAHAVAASAELGLSIENLSANPGLNSYLGCYCADDLALPNLPLSAENRQTDQSTCGHPCPPEVSAQLRENLDFLLLHPFITSAGNRYLPWFGAEILLVETFPEGDVRATTGLLNALGLSRRQGLARHAIEDALLTRGVDICRSLGLDAEEFCVANVPFDAYLRLGPKYGWGQRELWTHLDGYQVTRDLKLWALVGGHSRFGGHEDLSSVPRTYDAELLTARFAILRRQRFLAREAELPAT